jgi:AAA domain
MPPLPPPLMHDAVEPIVVVSLSDFVAVDEQGVGALVGSEASALIPEGGDVMFYGDGGAGKTTLAIDLAFHIAAGDEWVGIAISRPAHVLLIEAEGPRPLYRAKLRRKNEAWAGSPVDDRITVLERPWARASFADDDWRAQLADTIASGEIDVVIAGPVTRLGMNEAGTLQEVRDFMALIDDVRRRSGQRVAVVLNHHENKGGKVSGAWEGAGDTLLHVQARGHGNLRLYVEKARWSSSHHKTTLQLVWAEGEGFALAEAEPGRPERSWDEIATYVRAHGGCNWRAVERTSPARASTCDVDAIRCLPTASSSTRGSRGYLSSGIKTTRLGR